MRIYHILIIIQVDGKKFMNIEIFKEQKKNKRIYMQIRSFRTETTRLKEAHFVNRRKHKSSISLTM